MRDFTLEDFDRHFGADIDGMGTVSLDDPYISGDDAVFNAVSGESERLIRARRYAPEGHAQTDGAFFTRRAWVPGNAIVPCAILSGGSLIYRRGAVYTATAGAASGETFNYIRVRFFACHDEWGSGQALKFTFRGWAWSPEDRATGVWTEYESPNGVWVCTGTFSQQTGGVLSE